MFSRANFYTLREALLRSMEFLMEGIFNKN